MKNWLFLLVFIPVLCFAQKDTSCSMDMYGCYVFSIKSLLKGSAGLEVLHQKSIHKKTTTLYIPKRFYTAGLPEEIDGYKVQYIELDAEKSKIYDALKNNTAALFYMSELNVTASVCDLWLMPVSLEKVNNRIEVNYAELGSHIMFKVCSDNGKLGYNSTINPLEKTK